MTANAGRGRAWHCVRTRPKTEHRVADRLAALPGVEPFCPRMRYRRPTRRGPVWFSEALFPSYVFARFAPAQQLRSVLHTPDVRGLVRFGETIATVPAPVIAELRRRLGAHEILVFDAPLEPGEEAQVADGPFAGLTVVVTRVLPARERVRILFTWLGRETEAELPLRALARTRKPRALPREEDAP